MQYLNDGMEVDVSRFGDARVRVDDGGREAGAEDATRSPLADLASTNPSIVERAKESLAEAGLESIDLLLEGLDAHDERLRLRSISLLSLIADPRTEAAMASLLHDPQTAIRQRAAGALARMPSRRTVAALSRLLSRESHQRVRISAVHSLVRLVQTGHDEAAKPAICLMSEPTESWRLRNAAMEVLRWISTSDEAVAVQPLLQRLSRDADARVARKARRLLESPGRPRLEPWALNHLVESLGSTRLAVWRRSVSLLSRVGGEIVEPIVESLLARPTRSYGRRAFLVLKGLSPRQLSQLAPYLTHCDDPIVLLTIVAVIEASGSRALLAEVARLIHRIADQEDGKGAGPLYPVRLRAHLALARGGSRLAIDDLRTLLEDRRFPIRSDLAEAASCIATRMEIVPLLNGYRRCRGVSRLAIRDAFRVVARRERIRRTDRCFALLDPGLRRAAAEILGAPRSRGRQHVLKHRDGAQGRNPLLG